MELIKSVIDTLYYLLWGDIITIPLPGGSSLGLADHHGKKECCR